MKEEVLYYGENDRAFGILNAGSKGDRPVVVMFNAGLLHRTEPYRLNVELARSIASLGYDSVRFDLSGKGDTPIREGLSNRESVSADWQALSSALEKRLGPRTFVLMGLCSGADNAIKTAANDDRVHGMILLDPLPPRVDQSLLQRLKYKLTNPFFWLRLPLSLFNYVRRDKEATKSDGAERGALAGGRSLPQQYSLRGLPSDRELKLSLERCLGRVGVFGFFTSYSFGQYVTSNQLQKGLGLQDSECCRLKEIYRPDIDHLVSLAEHREFLIESIMNWLDASKVT